MRALRCLAWVATLAIAACGGTDNSPAKNGSFVCTNNLTGACEPCPGVTLCVDPVTCLVTACGGGDIAFGGEGVGSTDAGPSDGATSDTGAPDTVASDTVAPDTGTPDTGAPDTGTPDTGAPDTGAPDTGGLDGAVCTDGIKSCADPKTPQFCFQGKWMALAGCGSGDKCSSGKCVCAKECVALGQQTCEPGVAAFKTCQLDGACLKWGVPLACQPGQVCESGQCKAKSSCTPACAAGKVCVQGVCQDAPCTPACAQGQVCKQGVCVANTCNPACPQGQVCSAGTCQPANTGTLTCGQIVACISQFSQGPNDTVNINACVGKGTAAAQDQYTKRKNCIKLSCQKLIDAGKVNEAMLCVYTYCGVEQTGCVGSGTKTCDQLGSCLSGCGTSVVCTTGCHSDASISGVKTWYSLTTCGDQYCAGKSGNDYATCTTQSCAGPYQACFGTTGGGGYSCAQVLQCAQGCTTKSCAGDCKAKASAQGLQDLNNLLGCNDKYCKSYCDNGTQQQCSACLQVYCSKEQNACN